MEPTTFHVTYCELGDGTWYASILAVPGCHADGDTRDEARVNVVANLALFFDDVAPERIVDT